MSDGEWSLDSEAWLVFEDDHCTELIIKLATSLAAMVYALGASVACCCVNEVAVADCATWYFISNTDSIS